MGKRVAFTAADVPLVGGALVLDFLNTTGDRRSDEPRERLHTYADLLVWGERAGLLDPTTARRLRAASKRRAREAAAALRTLLRLREDLYAIFAPLASGGAPEEAAVRCLEGWLAEACAFRSLEIVDGRAAWTFEPDPGRLDSPAWPILGSAEEVLMGGGRIKKCGECDWLFLDRSKNASRRWCKKLCADRVRSRRYYRRRNEG